MTRLGLKPAAILIGFVLGPVIERELIRSYQIGGFARFLQPTSLTILIIIAITVALSVYRNRKERAAAMSEGEAAIAAEEAPPEIGTREAVEQDSASYLTEKLLAVLALGFAAFLLISSLSYELFASLWIYFVAGPFIALPSAIMLARHVDLLPVAVRAWRRQTPTERNWVGFGEKSVVIGAFLFYIATMPLFGFLLGSVLFVFGLVLFFDRKVTRALYCALGTGAMLWLVLRGFQIYMPQGIFINLY
jgi:putative tricarboxylic transport membrane protein